MAEQAVDRGDEVKAGPAPAPAPSPTPAPEPEKEEVEKEEPEKEEPEKEARAATKEHTIPKSRFDEAVGKERERNAALARKVQELESRQRQIDTSQNVEEAKKELRTMIREHTSLLADGELDKASALMEGILQLQQDMADTRVRSATSYATNRAKQEVHYDNTVARMEISYPAINPDNEAFDEQAVRRIQALMTGLIQGENMTPAAALEDAVTTILGRAAGPAAKAGAADTGMRRKESAVAKAVDAQNRQPASTRDVGVDSDKLGGAMDASAVAKMSWEEFIKLPEAELSKMRGDYVN